MARRQEKKDVADILTAGLDTAFRAGKLTAGQMQYWSGKVGREFNLPDMIPVKDGPKLVLNERNKWVSYPVVHTRKVKKEITRRLIAMGAPVAEKLLEMKRRHEVKAKLKSVQRVKLPG